VSKHIKDLEDELGIELFVRRGKRLTGLTEPGKELAEIVERILMDARNIKRLAEQFSNRDEGRLHIVTTHTQPRYRLPPVVARFKQEFPRVHLVLHQANPAEIVTLLNRGEADVGIATEALEGVGSLASSWHKWNSRPWSRSPNIRSSPTTRATPVAQESRLEVRCRTVYA